MAGSRDIDGDIDTIGIALEEGESGRMATSSSRGRGYSGVSGKIRTRTRSGSTSQYRPRGASFTVYGELHRGGALRTYPSRADMLASSSGSGRERARTRTKSNAAGFVAMTESGRGARARTKSNVASSPADNAETSRERSRSRTRSNASDSTKPAVVALMEPVQEEEPSPQEPGHSESN